MKSQTPHDQSVGIPEPRNGRQDVFAEARERFTVADVWVAFGYKGVPKPSCKSPFRDDNHPSFSIFNDGKGWKDHATGEGGDVIEFVRIALGRLDHREVREWFTERLGPPTLGLRPNFIRTAVKQKPLHPIQWPARLDAGTPAMWEGFAAARGITYRAVWVLVQCGLLRFTRTDGCDCYVVTDDERRAAEIRRLDGKPFGQSKAFPLKGCDKRWLPGADLLRDAGPNTAVLVVEGATDLLSALDLLVRYRRVHGGENFWSPIAILGAKCKTLDEECAKLIRGRHVRLIPDADKAGDEMRDHWTEQFRRLGCTVDIVTLIRGTDLTDHLSTISPTNLFSR